MGWSIRTIPRYPPLDIIRWSAIRPAREDSSRGDRRAARRAAPVVRCSRLRPAGAGRGRHAAAVRPRRPPDRGRPDRRGARDRGRACRPTRTPPAAPHPKGEPTGSPRRAAASRPGRSACARSPVGSSASPRPDAAFLRRAGHSSRLVSSSTARGPSARDRRVGSRRGSSSMVRAAGLYPAGSRFESWLPYHPRASAGRPTRSPECPRSARPALSAVKARAGGSEASHAGTSWAVTTAQAGVRVTVGSVVTTAV